MASEISKGWNSDEAKEKRELRQRRHTLDEETLFKSDIHGGQFATIFSKEENWVTKKDTKGIIEKTHSITRMNQDSTGRVVKEYINERVR